LQNPPQDKISPKFRFEPGSYGDIGHFFPSIISLKQVAQNKWVHHFVLVCLNEHYKEEKSASSQAEEDLDAAFLHKEKLGSDFAVAEYLKAKGYVSVSDFNIVGGR